MSAIAEVLKEFSPEILGVLVGKLDEEEQGELCALIEQEEHDDIIARCSERVVAHDRGPMYWLRNWTKTENFQWQAQGLQPKEAFPYKPHAGHDRDYMDVVMGYILEDSELYIPKTREMMTSWLVTGYITWM